MIKNILFGLTNKLRQLHLKTKFPPFIINLTFWIWYICQKTLNIQSVTK
jgi:hypothetical protein